MGRSVHSDAKRLKLSWAVDMSFAKRVEKVMDGMVSMTAGSYKMGRRSGKRLVDKFSE